MRKRLKQTPVLRYVAAIIFVGCLYGLIFQLPAYLERRKNYPQERIAALRAAIVENTVLLSSLASVDGSSAAATETVASLQSELSKTNDDLQGLLKQPLKGLADETVGQVAKLLEQQEKLLKDYVSRYEALKKPLSYDLSDDLGALDITAESEEIARRAKISSQKLKEIGALSSIPLTTPSTDSSFELNNGILPLTPEIRTSFNTSADCLSRIESESLAKLPNVRASIETCDAQYSLTKRLCLALVSDVFDSETARNLNAGYAEILKNIDSLATDG